MLQEFFHFSFLLSCAYCHFLTNRIPHKNHIVNKYKYLQNGKYLYLHNVKYICDIESLSEEKKGRKKMIFLKYFFRKAYLAFW